MSHPSEMQFVQRVKDRFPEYFSNVKVLEVGSLDINGTVRGLFTDCDYTGIDVGEGMGVDKVISGHLFNEGTFDVTCSCECFEHNQYWVETFQNMHRITTGLLFLTCATTGRPEHGTINRAPNDSPFTNEYYRNLTIADFLQFDLDSMFSSYGFEIQKGTINDLYFWGIK